MRKFWLFVMLALVISDNVALDQFFKISFLVEHFQEHRQRDNRLSLVSFLEMHYWGEDLPDHDDEQDNQLPFKKPLIDLHFDFFSPAAHVKIIRPMVYHNPTYGLPRNDEVPQGYLNRLLKPPRIPVSA